MSCIKWSDGFHLYKIVSICPKLCRALFNLSGPSLGILQIVRNMRIKYVMQQFHIGKCFILFYWGQSIYAS